MIDKDIATIDQEYDAIVVGGGPAGLAAAIALYKKGIQNILVVEREKQLGGILRQCIHDGFGLTRFKTTLSGPEYAQRLIDELIALDIPYIANATVLEITNDKVVTAATREGLKQWRSKTVILAMGCRERTRGALSIPGERPTGVLTAGVAQAYMNLYNVMPAKEVIILGSGDIGLIMARRLTLEGAHVQAVLEIQEYPSGLPRNIEQCLHDYNIPLYLSHTVTAIHGTDRLTGITVSQVDKNFIPVLGSEKTYSCDTLILSVGLIPENELSIGAGVAIDTRTKGALVDEHLQTSLDGVFSAGNVLHVHDLVDFVSLEGEKTADRIAQYIQTGKLESCPIQVTTDTNIIYTMPQAVSGKNDVQLSLRVKKPYKNCRIIVRQSGIAISSIKMKKAIPAEMIQLLVKTEKVVSNANWEVCVE